MNFFSFCIQKKKRNREQKEEKKKENWIDGPANRLKYDWIYFDFPYNSDCDVLYSP